MPPTTTYDFVMKRGDQSPAMQRTLTDEDDNPIDIEDATVKFLMRPVGYDKTDSPTIEALAVNEDDGTGENTGQVRYEWLDGDTDTVGTYLGEFEVEYRTGTYETFPNDRYLYIRIDDDLGGVS